MSEKELIHKGNQFKKILKHGSWYFVASLLTKSTSFFLLPVYTKYLSPADYGILNSLNSINALFPIFTSLYLDAAFGRYYFEEKISIQRVKNLYSTIFWFITIWGAFVVIIGLATAPFTFQPLLDIPFFPYIPLTLVPMLFGQLSLLGSVYLRSNLLVKEVTIINILMFLCSTSLTLLLLIPYRMGIQANLYGSAVGWLINFGCFLYISVKYSILGFTFDLKILRKAMIFSLPLIPNIAGGWISGLSNRLILAYYGKIDQVGLYSVSAQIAMVLYMINDAVTQVQGPIGMSALTEDREKGKKQVSEFLSIFIWVILFFYLILVFFSKEVLYIMTDKRFHSAYKIVSILAFLYVMSGVYRVFTTILAFHGKNWVISSGAIVSAIISMILNFIFIPFYGQWAAAWASFFSVLGYTVWIVAWSQKYDPISINYHLIITNISISAFFIFVYCLLENSSGLGFWQILLTKIILCFIYIISVFVLPSLNSVKLIIVNGFKSYYLKKIIS